MPGRRAVSTSRADRAGRTGESSGGFAKQTAITSVVGTPVSVLACIGFRDELRRLLRRIPHTGHKGLRSRARPLQLLREIFHQGENPRGSLACVRRFLALIHPLHVKGGLAVPGQPGRDFPDGV